MKSEVAIRFASENDAPSLAALASETFHDAFVNSPQMSVKDLEMYLSEAFSLRQIYAELGDPNATFLIAEIANQPAAYAKLVSGSGETRINAKKPIKLQRLYSRQKFIGQGLGAALMRRCLLEAAERQHDVIWLRVWEHNLQAQSFYLKWNFESVGTIDFQLGNLMLTDIVMRRAV